MAVKSVRSINCVYARVCTQVGGIVGSGSLHALEVDTEGAVEEYKEVLTAFLLLLIFLCVSC